MSCFDMETNEVCYTDADGVRKSLMAHYEYGQDAAGATILVSTRYTEADGITVVDTADGTVVAGACPVAPSDVEWVKQCDVADDGTSTEFFCRTITSFDSAGMVVDPVKVDYFAMDKVTIYEPAGTVGECPNCPPATAQGVLTSWGK